MTSLLDRIFKRSDAGASKKEAPAKVLTTKRAILVSGANHSGSTLLGAMIGASPNWSDHPHVGEAHAFFDKNHELFGVTRCATDHEDCEHWSKVKKLAPTPFRQMLRKFDTDTIVDSSKLKSWFDLVPTDFETHHVLIWRCPMSLQSSFRKRLDATHANIRTNSELKVTREFCKAYSGKFVATSLEALTADPESVLEQICEAVDIPFFPGKSRFWEYENHHFGGARMVRKVVRGEAPQEIVPQEPKNEQRYQDFAEFVERHARFSIA